MRGWAEEEPCEELSACRHVHEVHEVGLSRRLAYISARPCGRRTTPALSPARPSVLRTTRCPDGRAAGRVHHRVAAIRAVIREQRENRASCPPSSSVLFGRVRHGHRWSSALRSVRGADIQKVPSLDFCKLLGCNLIICSNPSGVFSTVTHSVVQVVQVVREPLLDRSSLRHVVATAQPLNRSAPRHRYRARATAQNRSTLRHVIAAAQPLKSAPRHRCRSTGAIS